MQQSRNLSRLALAAAMTFTLAGFHGVAAQQAVDTVTKASTMVCPEMAYEGAYETSTEFIAWLLARPARMNVIGNAELRSIFREFAERQLWRNRLAAGHGAKG